MVSFKNQLKAATLNRYSPQILPTTKVGTKIMDRIIVCSEYEPHIIKPPVRKLIPTPTVKIIFPRWTFVSKFEDIYYTNIKGPPGMPKPPVTIPAIEPAR